MRVGPSGESRGEKVAVSASQEEASPELALPALSLQKCEKTHLCVSATCLWHFVIAAWQTRAERDNGASGPGRGGCGQRTGCLNQRVLHFLTYMPAIIGTLEMDVYFPRGQQELGWEGQR